MARTRTRHVRDFFTTLPPEYRECRVRQHRWDIPVNVIPHRRPAELEVVENCSMCGAQRTQFLGMADSNYGRILDNRTRIKHPKDYVAPKGSGGWATAEERGYLRMARLGY